MAPFRLPTLVPVMIWGRQPSSVSARGSYQVGVWRAPPPASTSAFTGVLFCAMFSASFDVFRFCLDYSIFPGRFLSVFVTKNVL